jgi:hypothetical protein
MYGEERRSRRGRQDCRRRAPLARAAMIRTALALAALAAPAATIAGQGHPERPAESHGTATRATHAPQPELPPLVAWQHVQRHNATYVRALRGGSPLPALPERPAGAGRYVCAVIVCADADFDVAPLLGLHRRDVLLLSLPGGFVDAATTALLEHLVVEERLSLVLLLHHAPCRTLARARQAVALEDALLARFAPLAPRSHRDADALAKALLLRQREHVLAASGPLRRAHTADKLRVVPGSIDQATAAITWWHLPVDALPLAPVK